MPFYSWRPPLRCGVVHSAAKVALPKNLASLYDGDEADDGRLPNVLFAF
jgi:hypothetical protein